MSYRTTVSTASYLPIAKCFTQRIAPLYNIYHNVSRRTLRTISQRTYCTISHQITMPYRIVLYSMLCTVEYHTVYQRRYTVLHPTHRIKAHLNISHHTSKCTRCHTVQCLWRDTVRYGTVNRVRYGTFSMVR